MNMEMGLCDSFDEEDIDQLEAELESLDGPSLNHFQRAQQQQPIISFRSTDIIKSFLQTEGRDIKFVGRDEQSVYEAFFYVLLMLGVEQKRNYPHLNTLIKQQFYKPHIFSTSNSSSEDDQNDQSRAMLDKCLQYFEQIADGMKIDDYILRQPLFERACVIMLKNSVELDQSASIYEQLADKFNIDMSTVHSQANADCFLLGATKTYYIIRQYDHYFLAVAQTRQDLNQSKLEMESIRSGQSGLHLIAVEPSDQSTPKFKNSEARYRKKSHKNSFGGDLQIVQYRDLLHLQSQRLSNGNNHNINNNENPKVLSEYFDMNEIESCVDHLDVKIIKKHTFQDIIDSEKKDMKGSSTFEPQINYIQRRKDRKISSSEIIQCRDFNQFQKKGEERQSNNLVSHHYLHHAMSLDQKEEEIAQIHKSSSFSQSNGKDELLNPIRMRTSLIHNKELERIEERQSSQKQSTHHQQSQPSDVQADGLDNESLSKLKDRKYSYFTQQMAKSTNKKINEIQSSNYVFKIPRNVHKNSQVINPSNKQHQFLRKRFQQNPLRFSQLGSPSQQSNQGSTIQNEKQATRKNEIRLVREVYSYQIKFQPNDWYRKEVIYHLNNGKKEVMIFQKSFIKNEDDSFLKFKEQGAWVKQSFGSSNTLLSNIKMKHSHLSAQRHPLQSNNNISNPYELNETSFLKNRIHSLANLDNDDQRSVVFSTSRSLKQIQSNATPAIPSKCSQSNTRISFSYLPTSPSNKSNDQGQIGRTNRQIVNNPLLTNRAQVPPISPQKPIFSAEFIPQYIPRISIPPTLQLSPQQPLQFRQSPTRQFALSPQAERPQTFSGSLLGPGPELRFVRR